MSGREGTMLIEAFYESQPDEAERFTQLNRALIHIALLIVAAGAALFVLVWLIVKL